MTQAELEKKIEEVIHDTWYMGKNFSHHRKKIIVDKGVCYIMTLIKQFTDFHYVDDPIEGGPWKGWKPKYTQQEEGSGQKP